MTTTARFGVLIIGDEILSGRRTDKHLSQCIQILDEAGQSLAWARYSGDDSTQLVQQFEQIFSQSDICFSFGGIGATVDDNTRQAVAKALGIPLVRHEAAVKLIEDQFGEQAYPNRILMADLPQGANLIPNPYNRIPGFSIKNIYCLPGFPVMAWPMMKWVLETTFRDLKKNDTVLETLLLQQVHESEIIETLNQIQQHYPAVKVSSLPSFSDNGGIRIEVGVEGLPDVVEKAMLDLSTELKKLTRT